jgi:hypothetical protein
MSEKQIIAEGDVSMVSVKGMSVSGATLGAGELVKIGFRFKEPSPINDWPLGQKVRITVETVE